MERLVVKGTPAKEHMEVPVRFKEDHALMAAGEISGIASVSGSLVRAAAGLTIIERGAWVETSVEDFDRIKFLRQHVSDRVIGVPTFLEETLEGLEFRARIAETLDGRETIELIRAGVLDAVSVGFDVDNAFFDDEGIRHVTKASLWEISVVTWGADSAARITEVNEDASASNLLSPKYLKRELQVSKIKQRQAKTMSGMLQKKMHRERVERWERELEDAERAHRWRR